MRRLVVALTIALLAFGLSGCGGGGSTATPAATTPPPAPAPAPTTSAEVTGISDNEPPVFEPFPMGSTITTEVAERVAAKQPTLIYFYDSGQYTGGEDRAIIDKVLDDNRGLVELVAYDIGEYTTIDASGTITIDPEFSNDPVAQQAVGMARTLGVSFTPYFVLTDSQGYIIWKFRGLVDRDFLDREIQRASL